MSAISKTLVLGVKAIHEAQPDKAILIDGITDDHYRMVISAGAFHALGSEDVYSTPGSFNAAPDDDAFVAAELDPAVAYAAVAHHDAVVYFSRSKTAARQVVVGSRLYSYLLGQEGLKLQDGVRWMPGAASLSIARPASAGESLLLTGYCWS